MGQEASKTRELWPDHISIILAGEGLDIGAGQDPISPGARVFDLEDGDAGRIDEYVSEKFDYVFSSHCLEHMVDPVDALARWWKLVRPRGHLILLVPDENLYEQGYWPSIHNTDHKHTFRLGDNTWSPVSICVPDLIRNLPDVHSWEFQLQDHGCCHHSQQVAKQLRRSRPRLRVWILKRIRKTLNLFNINPDWRFLIPLGFPVDQTAYGALAQIRVVVKKRA